MVVAKKVSFESKKSEASLGQERLWFLCEMAGEEPVYNVGQGFILEGKINKRHLKEAFDILCCKHESLRTTFSLEGGGLYQIIHTKPLGALECRRVCLEGRDASDVSRHIEQTFHQEIEKQFDLSEGPLIRGLLIEYSKERHGLIFCLHHTVTDGWSLRVLFEDLANIYQSICLVGIAETKKNFLKASGYTYQQFAFAQRSQLQGQYKEGLLNYWEQRLQGVPEKLELPFKGSQTKRDRTSYRSHKASMMLDGQIINNIEKLARRFDTTPFHVYLLCWYLLLGRYSNQDDVVVGVPAFGRDYRWIPNTISHFSQDLSAQALWSITGYFINTIPVRLHWKDTMSFNELLGFAIAQIQEDFIHQEAPLEEIIKRCNIVHSAHDTPLFQTSMVYQKSIFNDHLPLEGISSRSVAWESGETMLDLDIEIIPHSNDKAQILLKYNKDAWAANAAQRMLEHFRLLLTQVVENPDVAVGQHFILTPIEHQQLLIDWNKTGRAYPQDKTVHGLFEEQVGRTPDNVAVVYEDEQLTYRELNAKANQLAHYLREQGVGPEVLVGIACERSLEMVIGILGILKAGGAYVPLDPSYPKERLEFMLKDTQALLLLTQKALRKTLPKTKAKVVCLDEWSMAVGNYPTTNPIPAASANNLAYVIYTSGSTGQPKGVMVEHRGLVNYVMGIFLKLNFLSSLRVAYFSTFATDLGNTLIYSSLLFGNTLYLLREETSLNPFMLVKYIQKHHINLIKITPTHFEALQEWLNFKELESLKYLIFGGEKLNHHVVRAIGDSIAKDLFLINHYGPTEATIGSLTFNYSLLRNEPQFSNFVPIGKPLSNTVAYILDGHLQPVPIGVTGELYLGGEGLARGYLNRPELTAERFIVNPFVSEEDKARGRNLRLYRTGDLCRYLEDGNIEYIGRIDNQVKIRGFRIELGEIETALLSHAAVKEAVVVAREIESGHKQLVAYYVRREDQGGQDDGQVSGLLRNYLGKHLPDYMIPLFFICLEKMPLTPNGKLDRNALPLPEGEIYHTPYVAPRNEKERILVGIWQDVLHMKQVGIHHNFFELGGDSIVSIQVVARARQHGLNIQVRDIFRHTTIARLSEITPVDQTFEKMEKDNQGLIPLLPIQERFFDWTLSEHQYYVQSNLLILSPGIDKLTLEQAIRDAISNHDVFRIRFVISAHQQRYEEEHSPIVLHQINLSGTKDFCQSLEEYTVSLQKDLNLEQGPLYQVALIDGAPDKRLRLFIIIHHLIVDGVSWRILIEDLETAYKARAQGKEPSLAKEQSSYKDWSIALREEAKEKTSLMRASRAYWLKDLKIEPMPRDFDKKNQGIRVSKRISWQLGINETSLLLRRLPQNFHTTTRLILLTALAMAYRQWSHHTSLFLHLEGHGREERILKKTADLSRTMGWFTSIYPLNLKLPSEKADLRASLRMIREQLQAIPGRGLGYWVLRYLSDKSTQEALKQYDEPGLVFNYMGQFAASQSHELFEFSVEPRGTLLSPKERKWPLLVVDATVMNERLVMEFNYDSFAFREDTVKQFADYFYETIHLFIKNHNEVTEQQWLSPADLPLISLSQAQIDKLIPSGVIDVYPLTPLQQGILFHGLKDSGTGTYIVRLGFVLDGKVDEKYLKQAWERVIADFDVLRMAVLFDEVSEPLQLVYKEVRLPWQELDWTNESDWQERLQQFFSEEGERGFDLSQPPLLRLYWIKISKTQNIMVLVNHHLLLDGWSTENILRRVRHYYHQLQENKGIMKLKTAPYQNYVSWIKEQSLEQAKEYWMTLLDNHMELTTFPFKRAHLARHHSEIVRKELVFDSKQTALLVQWAQQQGFTLNTLVQGGWGLLLNRYTGHESIVFGHVVSGRMVELDQIEEQVGLFINTIPLRVFINSSCTGLMYLKRLQEQLVESQRYACVSLAQIQNWMGFDAQFPLIDHLTVFENYPIVKLSKEDNLSSLSLKNVIAKEQTNYGLTIVVTPGESLRICFDYDTGIYEEADILCLKNHFSQMLFSLITNPNQCVSDYSMLSAEERQRLLIDWNKTGRAYPQDKTVHGLFEEQVGRTPDNVAVVYEDEQLTYRELNAKANQLAHYLREQGVGPEVLVGIACERSLEMVIGILGILKAGGAYVPLDPSYPKERLEFMLKDTQAPLLLTQKALRKTLPKTKAKVVCLDEWSMAVGNYPTTNLIPAASANNLAYVIYTSGSTGQPKGVMVEHRAINRLIFNQNYFDFYQQQTIVHAANTAFDATTFELWGSLLLGSKMLILGGSGLLDFKESQRFFQKERNISLFVTTALFQKIILEEPSLLRDCKSILFGGEACDSVRVSQYLSDKNSDTCIIHVYGPTECTTFSTFYRLDQNTSYINIPIGRPISNTTCYILDGHLQPVPIGVTGELYLGGEGLARGYLNRPELTAERFIV
ncbi:TPA: amino acid adenylation domain-containing protein, partial [Legionella pneumophila]